MNLTRRSFFLGSAAAIAAVTAPAFVKAAELIVPKLGVLPPATALLREPFHVREISRIDFASFPIDGAEVLLTVFGGPHVLATLPILNAMEHSWDVDGRILLTPQFPLRFDVQPRDAWTEILVRSFDWDEEGRCVGGLMENFRWTDGNLVKTRVVEMPTEARWLGLWSPTVLRSPGPSSRPSKAA